MTILLPQVQFNGKKETIEKKVILMGTLACSTLLTSCASVTSGTHQTLSIATSPVQGAQFNLKNDKGEWGD